MSRERVRFLVFGNPMLRIDSMPIRLMPDLRKRFPQFEFVEFDPNENLEREGRTLEIIDSVEGIDKVTLITDIDSIQPSPVVSMHDFDLGYSLRLLKKLKLIDSVRIFGVPMGMKKAEAFRQLSKIIAASGTLG
ncbi:MAG: hypothetical protein KGH94_00195 [Candidatus Micrarchaeota archaeon]|nr:hypothetical protein [Candidatus Micrarchaeota archaeon]